MRVDPTASAAPVNSTVDTPVDNQLDEWVDNDAHELAPLRCITAIIRPGDKGDDPLVLYAMARRHGIAFDGVFRSELDEGEIERSDEATKRDLHEQAMARWRCTVGWLRFQTGLAETSVRTSLGRLEHLGLAHRSGSEWHEDRESLRRRFEAAHIERGDSIVVAGQVDYTRQILDTPKLSPAARRVAAYVWRRCARGPAWLGNALLCYDLGLSDKTMRRAIADAHAVGLIRKRLSYRNQLAPKREQWLGRAARDDWAPDIPF